MTLQDLLNERLNIIDAKRERQQQMTVFVFVGKRVAGEIAEAPSRRNIIRQKEGDKRPENMLQWAFSWRTLQAWYEAHTIQTGPNMRRWKG